MPPSPRLRVLKADTALTMRQMMEGVVLYGTGKGARVPGYAVGGKTGSAQIFDFATKHYTHTYNGSFVGFVPLNNPAFVMVVTLNGTHGSAGFGGAAAGPVFQKVATEALRVMEIPKDVPDEPPTLVASATDTDDLALSDGADEPNILEDDEGDDDAAPPPATEADLAGPRVPDFRGKTMSAVLAEATAEGLTVVPDGSGLARVQYPAPGSALRQGVRIRVRFAR